MNFLAYIITIAFFRILAILPRFLFHGVSDLLFLIIYYLVGYRKKVVVKNISNSFPEFSKQEIKKTTRKFYRHLADIMLESSATLYLSRRRLDKMYLIENPEIFAHYFKQGRNIIFIAGHFNNWEGSVVLSYLVPHKLYAVYKPLKNKRFDKEFRRARGRFDANVTPMKQIGRELIISSKNMELTATGLVTDQRPVKRHIHYWTDMLHQKTPVFLGSEKLAIKFDSVVLYMKTRKIKRGVYSSCFELITETPKETKEHEITEKHIRILEELIREKPAYYLWSHDRWKHKYPGEV